jgi:NADH-quinone oxidoreductase subunit L
MNDYLYYFLVYIILSGLVKACILGLLYFSKLKEHGEKHVQAIANYGGFFDVILVGVFYYLSSAGLLPSTISMGDVLGIHADFIYYTDAVSFSYILLSFVALGLLGRFSCFYLHKDEHYHKFFSLFYVFQTSMVLLILSDNFASYFIGWELLGISSVLLISFYIERKATVKNSLRIFTIYKVSDFFLFSGFAIAFSHAHLQSFTQIAQIDPEVFTIYLFLTSIAIMIKMGGLPVIWLPRAMEGPTTSSAIFYGALATHIPLLLFIKIWKDARVLPWAQISLICISIVVITLATLLSRVQSDAKNSLAYSTVKHIFIIAIEALLGFTTLAFIHLIFHCFYRLFQFLKTPSVIHEYQQIEDYNGNQFKSVGIIYTKILPMRLRNWLYQCVLKEFYIFPRFFRLIDILIGMKNRLSFKKVIYIATFNSLLFLLLVIIEWLELHTLHPTIFMLTPAWFFAIFALLINFHDWRYFAIVCLSVISLITVIYFADGFISLNYSIFIQSLLFVLLGLILYLEKFVKRPLSLNANLKLLLFILSLWIVGVPGPGTYYLFEKAIHLSMEKDMYLAIGAFVILSINTLSVIKNYSLDDSHFKRRNI